MIALSQLLSWLAIISRNPVLFSRTVRSNLDLFKEHNDTNLTEDFKRVMAKTLYNLLPKITESRNQLYGNTSLSRSPGSRVR